MMERLLPRHMQIIYLINGMHWNSSPRADHSGMGHHGCLLIDETMGRTCAWATWRSSDRHRVKGFRRCIGPHAPNVFRDLHALYPDASSTRPTDHRPAMAAPGQYALRDSRETVGGEVLDDPMPWSAWRTAPVIRLAGNASRRSAEPARRLARLSAERRQISVDPALSTCTSSASTEYKHASSKHSPRDDAALPGHEAEPDRDWTARV